VLRRLEALMLVANEEKTYLLSGSGDVIEPEDGVIAIGSGGNYALASARALVDNTDMSARDIVEKSLHIAASICVFTNNNLTIEQLESVA
jgi:ATP-dependent HslUV protease subunit HslV